MSADQQERRRRDAHLVVNAKGLVGILHQLMNRKRGVVRFDDGVRDLGARHDREGGHHPVRKLLADLGDEQRAHAGSGATTERVRDLEALETIATFGLAAHDIEHLIDELGTLGIMALGPVVAGARLTKDKVVRSEQLAKRTRTHGIHGTGLEVDEHGTGDIFVAGGLEYFSLALWCRGVPSPRELD